MHAEHNDLGASLWAHLQAVVSRHGAGHVHFHLKGNPCGPPPPALQGRIQAYDCGAVGMHTQCMEDEDDDSTCVWTHSQGMR